MCFLVANNVSLHFDSHLSTGQRGTMNIMSTHQCSWPLGVQDLPDKGNINKVPFSGYPGSYSPSRGLDFLNVGHLAHKCHHSARKCRPIFCSTASNNMDPYDSDDTDKNKSQNGEIGGVC